MASKLKNLVGRLSRRGPHKVLRGDLAFAGLPGIVCTPEEGLGLPAVAFGHDWLTSPQRYLHTLIHLASWGIVAAAPGTQRGPLPSHLALASDLRTTLDICAGVRLGEGRISVNPARLGIAGHGMGAGAAVLAATTTERPVAAVAALFPSPTSPSATAAAKGLFVPGLVVGSEPGLKAIDSDALALAQSWAAGEGASDKVVLRTVSKASEGGLAEGRSLFKFAGLPSGEHGTQRVTRALLTGFLLHRLAGDDTYSAFGETDSEIAKTATVDATELSVDPAERVVTLLGR